MSVRVDLSTSASLLFEREKEEVQTLLKGRKGIVYHLDWGTAPFDQPLEPYRIAIEQFKKELLHSAVKGVYLYPLHKNYYEGPLQYQEEPLFEEGGYTRIDLFRRDRLSAFLEEFTFPEVPLFLSVEGPKWWLHPTKFPWIQRKRGGESEGLLLPNIETDEMLKKFESFQDQERYRLLTEETLGLEWDGLETLWYIPAGVTKMGMRVLRGFEAAGGELKPF